MNRIDNFMAAEKERLEKIAAPALYDQVVEEAMLAAGLSAEEIKKALAFKKEEKAGETRLDSGKEQQNKPELKPAAGKKKRRLWLGAVAACAALLLTVSSFLPLAREVTLPKELPQSFKGVISITPTLAAGSLVNPAGSFLITSTEAIPKELVEKALILEPAFDYELLGKKGGKEYELIPAEPLEENSIYRIAFDPENSLADMSARGSYTWAFQTQASFQLTGTLPRSNTSMVPVGATLELYFTAPPDKATIEKEVVFTPEIPGAWQVEYNKAIYLPSAPLAYKTIYEMSIPQGLRQEGGGGKTGEELKVVFQTEASPAENRPENDFYFDIQGQNLSFRTGEEPYVQFYFNEWTAAAEQAQPPEIKVDIYSYGSSDEYRAALAEKMQVRDWLSFDRDTMVATEGLSLRSSFNLPGQQINYSWYLYFPESQEPGFYLAELTMGRQTRQLLFQVTDLSAYLTANDEEALLWVNDLAAGEAAAGARILIGDEIKATADSQGLAYIENLPPAEKVRVYDIRSQEKQVLLANTDWSYGYPERQKWQQERKTQQAYWNYLYVDRPLYRPGDTLYFFGLIAPRDQKAKEAKEVTLRLETYLADKSIRQVCSVSGGVLQGSFTLPVLPPGYYTLSMYLEDAYICGSSFQVAIYEKPAYQLSLAADKKAVMQGDTIQWTAVTSFFDGTPLAEQSIYFYGTSIESGRTIASDLNGRIQFTTKADGGNVYGLLGNDYISARAQLPEIGEIYRGSHVTVFTSDLELTGQAERSVAAAGEFSVELEAFAVDLNRIRDWDGDLQAQALAAHGGPVLMEAALIRQYWHKIEAGEKYNPYTKQMEPVYDYRLEEIPEDTFQWNYEGYGRQTFRGQLAYDDAYQLVISYKDRAGRDVKRIFYLPPAQMLSGEANPYLYHWLWVQKDDGKEYCPLGEEVSFKLYDNQAPLPGEGRYLFFRTREKIKDYLITEENAYRFRFNPEDIPGANIMAVYFDGHRYMPAAYPTLAAMDPAERALNVEIKTDKERYRPGETVIMDLKLTDAQNRPVEGVISLNLIDEALLAVQDQGINMGRQVFLENMYDFNYQTTLSHPDGSGGNMAEGGEGDGYREEFRDTVIFRTLYTDNNGRIRIEFALPDNITTWRVVWQAYKPDIWAGSGSAAIAVSLPFFTDIRFNGPILDQDEPILGLRSAGTIFSGETASPVEWTVNIPETGFSRTLQGQAFNWQELSLPAMAAGNYTLQVHSKYGDHSDSVTQLFSVLKSRQSYTVREEIVLENNYLPLGDEEGMTTVVFSDRARNQALQGLHLLAGQAAVRVEQRLAALEARMLLKKHFQLNWWNTTEAAVKEEQEQILRYQNQDGGIAFLPYGESDIYTSVWTASIGGRYFSRDALAMYFMNLLGNQADTGIDQTMVLWGAAASGRPVLPAIRQALQENSYQGQSLTGKQQLNLVCALIFAGSGNEALNYAQSLLAAWAEDLGGGLYRAGVSQDREEILAATAQMAAVAAVLDLPESSGLYRYLLENPSEKEYFLLEQLICLRSACEKIGEEASFAYTLDGEKTEVDLRKTPSHTLLLTPQQRQSISISQVSGSIVAESQYQKPGSPQPSLGAAEYLQISRTYRVSNQEKWSLPMNGKIQVVVDYRIAAAAPDGSYNIVDYLPTGLRYVTLDQQEKEGQTYPNVWLLKEEGNRLTFGLYKSGETLEGRLQYSVRVAMPGSYLAEPAMLLHSGLVGQLAESDAGRVYIH